MDVKPEQTESFTPSDSEEVAIETVDLSAKDIGFLLGKGGHTKRKLERISSARFEFGKKENHGQDGVLRIIGTAAERWCALEFVGWTCNMRTGNVMVDLHQHKHHCVAVEVPRECVGFVTGKRGAALREVEEEWGTFLFFAVDVHDSVHADGSTKSKLLIFGRDRWGRRGSQLKVMAAIEMKLPGSYVHHDQHEQLEPNFLFQDDDDNGRCSSPISQEQCTSESERVGAVHRDGSMDRQSSAQLFQKDAAQDDVTCQSNGAEPSFRPEDAVGAMRSPDGDSSDELFGTHTRALSDREYSYALGKHGSTKRKLALASDCIIEYVGRLAFYCGTRAGRERARHYTDLLLSQRVDAHLDAVDDVAILIDIDADAHTRSDVAVCPVPRDYIGFVRGTRGGSLREIEQVSRTLCFCDSGTTGDGRVLCYSHDADHRAHAIRLIKQRIDVKQRMDQRRHPGAFEDHNTSRHRGGADRCARREHDVLQHPVSRGPRSMTSQPHSFSPAPTSLLVAPTGRPRLQEHPGGLPAPHQALDHCATDGGAEHGLGTPRDQSRGVRQRQAPHQPADGRGHRGYPDVDERGIHSGRSSPLFDVHDRQRDRGSRRGHGDGASDNGMYRGKRVYDDDDDDDDSERGRTHWRDEKRQRNTRPWKDPARLSPPPPRDAHSARHGHRSATPQSDTRADTHAHARVWDAGSRRSPPVSRSDRDRRGSARW